IAGVRTNTGFLIRALRHPAFLTGDIDTGFIDRNIEGLHPAAPTAPIYARAAQRIIEGRAERERANDPWDAQDGFRLTGEARETLAFICDPDSASVVVVHHRGGGMSMTVDGTPAIASPHSNAIL